MQVIKNEQKKHYFKLCSVNANYSPTMTEKGQTASDLIVYCKDMYDGTHCI